MVDVLVPVVIADGIVQIRLSVISDPPCDVVCVDRSNRHTGAENTMPARHHCHRHDINWAIA